MQKVNCIVMYCIFVVCNVCYVFYGVVLASPSRVQRMRKVHSPTARCKCIHICTPWPYVCQRALASPSRVHRCAWHGTAWHGIASFFGIALFFRPGAAKSGLVRARVHLRQAGGRCIAFYCIARQGRAWLGNVVLYRSIAPNYRCCQDWRSASASTRGTGRGTCARRSACSTSASRCARLHRTPDAPDAPDAPDTISRCRCTTGPQNTRNTRYPCLLGTPEMTIHPTPNTSVI